MKVFISVVLGSLIISSGIVSGVLLHEKMQLGRYQLVSGEIETCSNIAREDSSLKETKETKPVLLRIDTATGQTWIYEDWTTTIFPTGESPFASTCKGFTKIPFETIGFEAKVLDFRPSKERAKKLGEMAKPPERGLWPIWK